MTEEFVKTSQLLATVFHMIFNLTVSVLCSTFSGKYNKYIILSDVEGFVP